MILSSRFLLSSVLPLFAIATAVAAPAEPGRVQVAQATAQGAGKGAAKPAGSGGPATSPLSGLGTNSKEPIKIDSDRLDVFDKDKKAVFSGNVVAVQGETTIRCTVLTVFYEQSATGKQAGSAGQAPSAPAPAAGGPSADNGIRKLDCTGPVTVVSKDQVATGDNATYDKVANKVVLIGNAKLSQGPNVTTGDRVVYDLNTSQATVEVKPGTRVKALLVPGSNDPLSGDKAGEKAAEKAKKKEEGKAKNEAKGAATN